MATNGYFIRELPLISAFAENTAFAIEDDVGPDSYHTTGEQMRQYFQTSGFEFGTGCFRLGTDAGQNDNGTNTGNIYVGFEAGAENVTGDNNTIFGHEAGKGVTGNSHSNNTFMGRGSGRAITTGSDNVAVGFNSMPSVTSGANNVAVGQSLFGLTTGQYNFGLGTSAGNAITTESFNTCVGFRAGVSRTGSSNTFIGGYAGDAAGASTEVLLIGYAAGVNAASSYSIGIGTRAIANGAGNFNVAVGHEGLRYNVTGTNNTILGYQAGKGVTGNSHSDNTFVGYQAGAATTTGSNRVFIGSGVGNSAIAADTNSLLAIDSSDTATPLVGGDFANDNFGINFTIGTDSYGASSQGVVFIGEATTVPTGNPSGGIVLYATGGQLWARTATGAHQLTT